MVKMATPQSGRRFFMIVKTLMATAVALAASHAHALQTVDYGWEDGVGTILGSFGNLVDASNVGGPQTGSDGTESYGVGGAHSGTQFLHVAEAPHSGTPQAYLAFVTGLQAGDMISASFWGFDTSAGTNPSLRIWGHYADANDIGSYVKSAGGSNTYTDGSGWSQLSNTWTFDGSATEGLVIEARLYSTTGGTDHSDFWIDDLQISAPDHASIQFAAPVPEPQSYALMLAGLGMMGFVARRRSGR
ncbi:PEP-CTERM sorting domain-containing protein [Denitromonas ohlonensis]|uniref:PEP-CTERM sorting domain-containing protein n=3 Tax=Denitromonas TaxID=139331 RepID=A0A557RW29_9RHOO|nr:PEP-CTERM sorting domain-containing protein [Denitromonas ohlonensis]TVO77456.1 PEP-CTERM sorting domain-containing protein [Denitromonas ohlonensis]